jgi:hypothetical protein
LYSRGGLGGELVEGLVPALGIRPAVRPDAACQVAEHLARPAPGTPSRGPFRRNVGSRDVLDVVLVRPDVVVEVSADRAVDRGGAFRHPLRFGRLRPRRQWNRMRPADQAGSIGGGAGVEVNDSGCALAVCRRCRRRNTSGGFPEGTIFCDHYTKTDDDHERQSGAPEGLQALELQGQPGQAGAVVQTFPTTAGVEITLTWIDAVDGRGGCGQGERQKYLVRVTSGDNVVEHGYEPKPSSGTEWLEKSITFRAQAGTSTVEFLSRSEASPTHCGAMITKVAVEQPQSTT